ncbi:MAG: ABC transporter permease [Chloroflexi bacterium]|nr:ABC transporter permease [Chloroflexota bacterium]
MAEAGGVAGLEEFEEAASRRERGLWSDAFRRLIRNRLAMGALIVLVLLGILAVTGNTIGWVQRYDPAFDYDRSALKEGPSWDHFFGTDNLGRDNWSRVLQGLLISLQVGLGVQGIVVVIGLLVGGTAALTGRLGDNILMRITDLAYAFPDLLFIILIRAVLFGRDWPLIGNERLLVIFAISFVSWTTVARLVRGQMLSLAERDYVIAARAMGASQRRIVFQHMLPNTLGPVIVAITFGIPIAIFAEAVLAFIGFGLSPPTASLGTLVESGYRFIIETEWMLIPPAVVIALLMLCFTFVGDGLRDALDPRAH